MHFFRKLDQINIYGYKKGEKIVQKILFFSSVLILLICSNMGKNKITFTCENLYSKTSLMVYIAFCLTKCEVKCDFFIFKIRYTDQT